MTRRLTPLCVLLLSAALVSQTSWTLLTPANSPPAYTAHAMAYYLVTDTTILFGGVANGVRSSDTWEWDGTNWTQLSPATVPTARVAHTMVYDVARSRLVMYGGIAASGAVLGDTWEWDGNDWTQMTPATASPGPRRSHCMIYHPGRGKTLLFGGYNLGDLNDTWEWDGFDWVLVNTANSPSPRRATDMAWDPVTDDVILFSGYQQGADTWRFDGTDWSQLAPANSPTARYDHAMITDRARDRIVMFGNIAVGDTWEWDGSNWLDRTGANPLTPRWDTYLAYDWLREEVTMFGSTASAETLSYAPISPAAFTVLGSPGCPGSNGSPPVLSSTVRPWLGEVFAVEIAQLPANGIALMINGLSDTNSVLGPLPASLAALGMPGCTLQVDPLIVDAVFASGTSATWTLSIPNDPTLLTQQFFSQCGALDVGVNAAGLTVGNYCSATIGGK